jgi:hypothetical protein
MDRVISMAFSLQEHRFSLAREEDRMQPHINNRVPMPGFSDVGYSYGAKRNGAVGANAWTASPGRS